MTRDSLYAALFAARIETYYATSVDLTDAVYDLAHLHATKTADAAMAAGERARAKESGT